MFSRTFLVFAPVAALSLALVGCSGTTACDCGPSVPNPPDSQENAIVQDLNAARTKAGVGTVTVCKSMDVSAAAHSDDMRDNGYLAEQSPVDGSDVRSRSCKAGYTPACMGTIPMAELVAEGNGTGDDTFAQWQNDPTAAAHLLDKQFIVVGLGHSIGLENQYWTVDLSSQQDPSCN